MNTAEHIDTEKFSAALRNKGINLESREILVTRFEGSQQAEDLSLPPNCGGFGRIHHFNRSQGEGWPSNPLPIDPALNALGLPPSDTVQVQVFQNAICSWRCWYCFVDFSLLSGDLAHSNFLTCEKLLDLYLSEQDPPRIIDLSGGQPDLVPEWGLWFADALRERGLDREVYLWTDDNLSNDYLWRYLRRDEIARLAASQNYGRVGCFKGFDDHSFAFNTKAAPELFASQFRLMRRLVDGGFDVYGYTTFTSDDDSDIANKIAIFIDRLQGEIHPLFPLRTVPLRVREFTPTARRMRADHERSLRIQEVAAQAWLHEIERRFPIELRGRKVFENLLSHGPRSRLVESRNELA